MGRLDDAWQTVRRNDAEDGIISRSVEKFAKDAAENLELIRDELRGGGFRPSPLTRVAIPAEGRKDRVLHVPSVRDRIVERALTGLIYQQLDRWFSPWSFAYRPGLGVRDAAAALVFVREAGKSVIIRCDISDCFDSLDRGLLLEALSSRVADEAILGLVDELLERPRLDGRRLYRSAVGAPQGGPLSPLLCNVYMDVFDLEMARRGFPVVRYADDMAIACRNPIESWEALMNAHEVAGSLGLELGDDKTSVTSFKEGFAFLGEDFTNDYPPDEPLYRVREPERRTLFVQSEGAIVRVSKGQVLVSRGDTTLLAVPSSDVGTVVCIGSANVSAGMRSMALRQGINTVFLSRRGNFEGWLQGSRLPNARTRRLQYQRGDDDEFRLELAKRFVTGKLANQRALLLRYQRREKAQELVAAAESLEDSARQVERSESVDEMLGYEGTGAAAYFATFGLLLPPWTEWSGRNRRPPRDPVNAALGFAYALLCSEAVSACSVAGLDPAAGFLHSDDGDRPSLALDLMEEFRALIADSVVMELVRRNRLQLNHFRSEADREAVLLTEKGRKVVIGRFEERMLHMTTHLGTRKRTSYRRAMYIQAARISACIKSGEVQYEAMAWR